MKKINLLLLLSFLSGRYFSQVTTEISTTTGAFSVHASVLGALKYPGFMIGGDYALFSKTIDKKKKNDRHKLVFKRKYITLNYGYYFHKDYHANHFLQLGYQLQRMNSKGWFTLFEPKIGLSRTVISGAVYAVDDAGTVKKQKVAGDFYFAPSLTLGFGKDFSQTNEQTPLALFAKATLFANTPYNNFIYARLLAEIGISYQFKNFLSHTLRLKTKTK